MVDFSVGEIVKLKLTGQTAQVLGRLYSRYDSSYLLRLTSLNVIILGEEEIEKVEEPTNRTKEE